MVAIDSWFHPGFATNEHLPRETEYGRRVAALRPSKFAGGEPVDPSARTLAAEGPFGPHVFAVRERRHRPRGPAH
jgi:hypothetical protein